MTATGKDPVRVRRALALALEEFVDALRVQEAVELWHRQFERQFSLHFGLHRYSKEVAHVLGLSGRENELHLKMFQALSVSLERLPADPLGSQEPLIAPVSGAGVATPSARTVQGFYEAVEERARQDGRVRVQRLRQAVLAQAAGWPGPARRSLAAWWEGTAGGLHGQWPAGGLGTQFVNAVYVALTELLGPVQADQCFTQAVARLESGPDREIAGIRRYL